MLNKVINKGQTLAIILRTTYKEKGINFFTPNEFSQQLAYMNHPTMNFLIYYITSVPRSCRINSIGYHLQ